MALRRMPVLRQCRYLLNWLSLGGAISDLKSGRRTCGRRKLLFVLPLISVSRFCCRRLGRRCPFCFFILAPAGTVDGSGWPSWACPENVRKGAPGALQRWSPLVGQVVAPIGGAPISASCFGERSGSGVWMAIVLSELVRAGTIVAARRLALGTCHVAGWIAATTLEAIIVEQTCLRTQDYIQAQARSIVLGHVGTTRIGAASIDVAWA